MKYKIISFVVFAILGVCSTGCGPRDVSKEPNQIQSSDPVLDQLDVFNEKIRNDSTNPDLFDERAKFYLTQNENNEAFKDILTAIELDSTYSGYYITLADVYLAMGKLQKSVVSLEKSVDLNDKNPDAYLKLAEISIVILDYKKALDYIDKALKVDELQSKGYLLRGVVMLENGDTTRAIRNFQKAIDVNQDYFDAHMQLARLYAVKGNELAIDYFNNAMNIEPDNDEVIYSLAMFYQENKQYEKAIQHYNLLLEKNPDFYIALYNIGYIQLVYLQNYQEAINYFTQAIDIKNDYAEAYYNRGFAYELNKDAENSFKDYKKTLELIPNYDKAIEGLNRIEDYRKNQ